VSLGLLIAGLADTDPLARWSLDRASEFLTDVLDQPAVVPAPAGTPAADATVIVADSTGQRGPQRFAYDAASTHSNGG
jgi:hypothetical protein